MNTRFRQHLIVWLLSGLSHAVSVCFGLTVTPTWRGSSWFAAPNSCDSSPLQCFILHHPLSLLFCHLSCFAFPFLLGHWKEARAISLLSFWGTAESILLAYAKWTASHGHILLNTGGPLGMEGEAVETHRETMHSTWQFDTATLHQCSRGLIHGKWIFTIQTHSGGNCSKSQGEERCQTTSVWNL